MTGTGLRFETGEHGGDYPDNMPQAITVTDAQGRWAAYVPLRVDGNDRAHRSSDHVRQGALRGAVISHRRTRSCNW
jgi:hypothetical protein